MSDEEKVLTKEIAEQFVADEDGNLHEFTACQTLHHEWPFSCGSRVNRIDTFGTDSSMRREGRCWKSSHPLMPRKRLAHWLCACYFAPAEAEHVKADQPSLEDL